MRRCLILMFSTVLTLGASEPTVKLSTVWIDTVKRGAMLRQVRALGTLSAAGQAQLLVPEPGVKDVRVGQAASVDTRQGVVPGRVARMSDRAVNATVQVDVRLEGALPPGAKPGMAVDGMIEIERLPDVVYIGRPVRGQAGSSAELFKVEPDGKYASRVPVRFGRSSVNTIEISGGLREGDRVILSDMSAWAAYPRIRLE